MQIRRWYSYEYAKHDYTITRQHAWLVLQIGQRVFTLWHAVGPWVDAAFNRVDV